jgi:hypothetical protein
MLKLQNKKLKMKSLEKLKKKKDCNKLKKLNKKESKKIG